MAWHLSKVEAAFGSNRVIDPSSVPAAAWIDITNDVADWDLARGRSFEMGEMEAVSGSITLDNDGDRYSLDYNPIPLNLLPPAITTGGSSVAGVKPDGIYLNSGLTNVALTAAADSAFAYPFSHDVNVTAGFAGTPVLYCGGPTDTVGTKFSVPYAVRIDTASTYRFRLQHRLVSGTGQAIKLRVYWLDSDGTVLSSTDSSTFTPTGTVTQANLTGLTPPGSARYAVPAVVWNAALAAQQRVRVTALEFGVFSNNTLGAYGYYPNVRPGVPLRITIRDSADATYEPCFYGHAGDWTQDLDEVLATVDLLDGFELLAEMDIASASQELMDQINPVLVVPFSDASGADRNKYAVETRSKLELTRRIKGSANARDLSEWTFGEPGPQDGTSSLYLDPESATVGYAAEVDLPSSLPLLVNADWTAWAWFRLRRTENRSHVILNLASSDESDNARARITVQSSGELWSSWGTSGGSSSNPILAGSDVADGEWHLVIVGFEAGTFKRSLWLDWDGTNGMTSNYSGGAINIPGTSVTISFGPPASLGSGYPRAQFSGFGAVDRALTTAEMQRLYAVGAPPATYPGESETTRIGTLLDFAGWPSSMRQLDTAVTTVTGPYPSGTNVLEAVKLVAESAGGVVFIGKDGKFRYANRRARYNPTTALTCSHSTATMPEDDVKPAIRLDHVYNRVSVARAVGNPIVVDDVASQAKYGIRVLDLDMPLLSDDEALQAGYWHLHLYAEPKARIGQLTFNASAAANDNLWDYLVDVDLMTDQAIDLNAVQLAGKLYLVERIALTYDADDKLFEGTLDVSPGEAFQNICVLDTAAELDYCTLGW